ncbi:uncharacterized protein M421DRAFT_104405 [Didymella exigua CBS 183.55]|uniref:Zn(2)-C6 fungal-type domain-containing protein n=1 Tax=Didymella exigua CBS 183.55 TaxID=1150837 RepID=A0A6A5R5Z8_9PLEO|nr:uncharacterized protein M421DRAFT_104405 [Didymella exigua CBS 183.55]KAF1923535.1 hypothetical protein M421DRAFT_104405 [Didymella exigua CBS 183.55]
MTRQRISAACDACRARKVKCLTPDGQFKCSTCIDVNIDCTRMQPRKKRGPKNRYVQGLRNELDADHDALATSLESLAPFEVVNQVIADWFGWIHPVAPILHQDRFMQQLATSHRSLGNEPKSFLLLVASVCAATVASLRRRRHLYLDLTVESCLDFTERLGVWSPSAAITLERSIAMYNFGTALHYEHGIDSPISHRLMSEAAMSVKFLIHQSVGTMSFADSQLLKRLYWLIYAGHCTSDMYGRQLLLLRQANDQTSALMPLEVSDAQLLDQGEPSSPDHIGSEHSYVPGLNALSRLFMVWQSSQATATQSMENLQAHIEHAYRIADNFPPELSWQGDHIIGDFGFNVQTVNLKITQLHIRANLLEQMNTIAKADGLLITPHAIIEERHRAVNELLEILYHMPTEVFDANGYSIIPKIRDIGSALLDELRTGSHGRTLQASVNLDRLLIKLEDLDLRPADATPYF